MARALGRAGEVMDMRLVKSLSWQLGGSHEPVSSVRESSSEGRSALQSTGSRWSTVHGKPGSAAAYKVAHWAWWCLANIEDRQVDDMLEEQKLGWLKICLEYRLCGTRGNPGGHVHLPCH